MPVQDFTDQYMLFNRDLCGNCAAHHEDAFLLALNALLDATGVSALPLLCCVHQQSPCCNRCSCSPPRGVARSATLCQRFITPSLPDATYQHT